MRRDRVDALIDRIRAALGPDGIVLHRFERGQYYVWLSLRGHVCEVHSEADWRRTRRELGLSRKAVA